MAVDVEDIAAKIKALPAPDKLRLAADLMEARKGETAYLILKSVVDELGAAIAIRKLDSMRSQR